MDLGSGIRKKPIPDPESRGQKGTGSRNRIRNTALNIWFASLPIFVIDCIFEQKTVFTLNFKFTVYTPLPVFVIDVDLN
jgi:hypothetical protein